MSCESKCRAKLVTGSRFRNFFLKFFRKKFLNLDFTQKTQKNGPFQHFECLAIVCPKGCLELLGGLGWALRYPEGFFDGAQNFART